MLNILRIRSRRFAHTGIAEGRQSNASDVALRDCADEVIRSFFQRLFAVIFVILWLAALPSYGAEEPAKYFDIKSKPLSEALMDFGVQSGLSVVAPTSLTSGKRSVAVHGNMPSNDALRRLLSGSGLTFTRDENGAIAVQSPTASGPGHDSVAPDRSKLDMSADETLQEVVVTAQKREQRLEDVPESVTALGASALAEKGDARLADYFQQIPSLSLSPVDGGRTTLTLRGVSTGVNGNPTVAITIDGVPYGSASGYGFGQQFIPDLDPADLQRLEVLQGPQGTLYGASSLGGLLNFVTVDPPTTTMTGRIGISGDAVDAGSAGYGFNGAIGIPVIYDVLGVGLSGFYRHDPGYIDDPVHGLNDVNSADVYGGRASLLWKIGSGATIRLAALYQDSEYNGTPRINSNNNLESTAGGELDQDYLLGTGQSRNIVQLYTANIAVDLGEGITLTSLTGYGVNQYSTDQDLTGDNGSAAMALFGVGGAAFPFSFDTRRISEELRFSGANSLFDWLLGGFYTHEHTTDFYQAFASNVTTGAPVGVFFNEADHYLFDEYAGFGDITFHLTDRIDLQAGVRYSTNRQVYGSYIYGGPFADPAVDFATPSNGRAVTYLANPSYKITKDILAYARVSSGYQPGGPNAGIFSASTPKSFNADTTTNYEIGVKGDLFDRLLSFDFSIYDIDWKDVQLFAQDPATGFGYTNNGGAASSKGVELSGTVRPTTGLVISANIAYTHAILDANLPPGTSHGLKGDQLPNIPSAAGRVDAEQSFALSDAWTGFVGGTVSYTGSRLNEFPDTAAEIRLDMPAYTTGDLRLGARNSAWTFTAFVKNVSDSHGVLSAGPFGPTNFPADPFYRIIIQPRTVGLTLTHALF